MYATLIIRAEAADGEYIEHRITLRKFAIDKMELGSLSARVGLLAQHMLDAEEYRNTLDVVTGKVTNWTGEPDGEDAEEEGEG